MIEREPYAAVRTTTRAVAREFFGARTDAPVCVVDDRPAPDDLTTYHVWLADGEPDGDEWRRD